MSGNLWMFSDMLDDEDIEMQKHDFITLYQGADYYGLGLKVFTRMAREASSVYKIGKKALIRRTIFDEYLRKVYKKELEKNSSDDSGKELMKRQGTMVTDEDSGRMDIRFGLLDYYGGLPRNITDRLVEQQYIFDEADAWLDLWCHTVSEDPDNAFSFLAPIAQFGKFGAVLTLETLGQRWNWEKTKVWRFFQKHGDVFTLHRLPGAFGCLIFNKLYPTDAEVSIPESEKIERIIAEIRILAKNKQKVGSDQENLSRLVALYSRQLLTECAEEDENTMAQNRVALFDPYILRAYFSHSNCKKCIYDCKGKSLYYPPVIDTSKIRGPCAPVNITKIAKEMFTYDPPNRRKIAV